MLNRATILEVVPHQDFSLEIRLSDGQHLRFDMKPFLSSPAYHRLSQLGLFLRVKHDHRLIYWDELQDIHIDQILDFSEKIESTQTASLST